MVPTLLVTKKFLDFSRTSEAFIQDPVTSQQCLNTETIYRMIAASMLEYIYVYHCHMLQRSSKETVWTLFTIIYTDVPYLQVTAARSSEVFQLQQLAVQLQIPGLSRTSYYISRTNLIFQDFPGPGNFTITVPGLSRRRGNPVTRGDGRPIGDAPSWAWT